MTKIFINVILCNGDDYIDVEADDEADDNDKEEDEETDKEMNDEGGDDAIFDNFDKGWCDYQWSLSCCLCTRHGDGRTSVQVRIMMMMMVMM